MRSESIMGNIGLSTAPRNSKFVRRSKLFGFTSGMLMHTHNFQILSLYISRIIILRIIILLTIASTTFRLNLPWWFQFSSTRERRALPLFHGPVLVRSNIRDAIGGNKRWKIFRASIYKTGAADTCKVGERRKWIFDIARVFLDKIARFVDARSLTQSGPVSFPTGKETSGFGYSSRALASAIYKRDLINGS